MFVIVVRLDKIEDSTQQLWYWLRFIKNRMSEQPSAGERPTVILVGSSRDSVRDRSIAREEKEGWVSDWGNEKLKEVCGQKFFSLFFSSSFWNVDNSINPLFLAFLFTPLPLFFFTISGVKDPR